MRNPQQQLPSKGRKLYLCRSNCSLATHFVTHAHSHYQPPNHAKRMHCTYHDPLWHSTSERKKHYVFSVEQFCEHTVVALGAIIFDRILRSHNGIGRWPLASQRATRTVSVHYLAHTQDCESNRNIAISCPQTDGRVQTSGCPSNTLTSDTSSFDEGGDLPLFHFKVVQTRNSY